MTDSKKRRRWKRAAAFRRKIKGMTKTTYYRLIRQGKLQSNCFTVRTTEICVGYVEDGKAIDCLTTPRENPIKCQSCSIPR